MDLFSDLGWEAGLGMVSKVQSVLICADSMFVNSPTH